MKKHSGHINLSNSQKRKLMEILVSAPNSGKYKGNGLNVYQTIVSEYNSLPEFKSNPLNHNNMPDYTKLKNI